MIEMQAFKGCRIIEIMPEASPSTERLLLGYQKDGLREMGAYTRITAAKVQAMLGM